MENITPQSESNAETNDELEKNQSIANQLRDIKPDTEDSTQAEKNRIEYEILTIDNYKQWITHEQGIPLPSYFESDEALRAVYIKRTEQLIDKLADTDVAVFLDKSARPIAWLVRELWPLFAPNKPESPDEKVKMPEMRFVNIDSGDWAGNPDGARPEEGELDVTEVPEEAIQELQSIFHDPTDPSRSQFDQKSVTLVDEVKVSGSTLQFAQDIFQRAFPHARVDRAYWMAAPRREDYKAQRRTMGELPIWYHDQRQEGRGVANRTADSHYLSSRPEVPDERAKQLRNEFHQLAQDIRSGEQAVQMIDPDNKDYSGMKAYRAPEKPKTSLFD